MEKYFDINKNKHSIRCKMYIEKHVQDVKSWVIATHGFGGDKESKGIKKLAERVIAKYKGYGLIVFDWPSHGKDSRNKMILDECLEYLDLVNHYALEELKAERIYNYSISMGCYFTLLYIHRFGNPYAKVALRSPALWFSETLYNNLTPEEKVTLEKKKEVKTGYERKVTITEDFIKELRENDVAGYDYTPYFDKIIIIHGTRDQFISVGKVSEFADKNVLDFYPIKNADHPFTNPDCMDEAISDVITCFAPEKK